MRVNVARAVVAVAVCFVVAGCGATHRADKAGARLARKGDEIVIAGQYFHTGAPVVLWTDPGGFDAYRTERRFVPWERASFEDTYDDQGGKPGGVNSPARYGIRFAPRATTQSTTGPSTTQRGGRGRNRTRATERPGSTTDMAADARAATRAVTSPASGSPPTTQATQPRRSPGERLTQDQFQKVRGGGWPLEMVQDKVDQFVYHYDVAGTAR